MNKVIMQLWEESTRFSGVNPDGCSIHISLDERNRYIDTIYNLRDLELVPDEYDRTVGEEMIAFVDDELFNIVKSDNTVRLIESDLNNLITMEEIIIKP